MPEYLYRAVDRDGHTTNGAMAADTELLLERRLTEMGYWLIDAKEQSQRRQGAARRVPRRQLIEFFNGMVSLLMAGIPIADALDAMAEETEHETLQQILRHAGVNVRSGNELSASMRQYPAAFPEQTCNLVQAGEHGGNLSETFRDISDHLEWVERVMADFKQASVYPALVVIAVCGLIVLMLTFVVPRFSEIFSSLDIALPAITRFVIFLGEFAATYWWLMLGALGGLIGFIRLGPQFSPRIAHWLDQLKLDLPIVGPVIGLLVQSQFVHNLALMLKSGVPILDALKLCRGLVDNKVMAGAIRDAELAVNQGRRMSDALRDHPVVSSLTLRMIVVGEESGRLEHTLQQVATRFDEEVPRRIKRVFAVAEPLIMLVLVGIVGGIAAAVFMPMLSIMSGLGG